MKELLRDFNKVVILTFPHRSCSVPFRFHSRAVPFSTISAPFSVSIFFFVPILFSVPLIVLHSCSIPLKLYCYANCLITVMNCNFNKSVRIYFIDVKVIYHESTRFILVEHYTFLGKINGNGNENGNGNRKGTGA